MVFNSYVPSAQEASRLVRKQKKNLMTAKDDFFSVHKISERRDISESFYRKQ